MKPAGAVLDLTEQTMTVRDTIIPLLGFAKKVEPVCRRAIAAVTTTLSPNSEEVVPVHLVDETRDRRPGWGLLQPTESHSNDGLLVGRTLVDLGKDVLPLRVMNMITGSRKALI